MKTSTLEERSETKAKVEIRISGWIVVPFNSKSSRIKACIRRIYVKNRKQSVRKSH